RASRVTMQVEPIVCLIMVGYTCIGVSNWHCAAAANDDPWREWRARQRAELTTLQLPPAPPPGKGSGIDCFVQSYWAKHKIEPSSRIDDRTFARRVFFDVVGLPPTPEHLERFLHDQDLHKRERLVDRLLADNQGYAENWISYWNDLLRNDEQT